MQFDGTYHVICNLLCGSIVSGDTFVDEELLTEQLVIFLPQLQIPWYHLCVVDRHATLDETLQLVFRTGCKQDGQVRLEQA